MKEILFKGKRITGDEWVEGDFLTFKGRSYIVRRKDGTAFAVIPETVSIYTGTKDVHGNKIFDKDIVVLTIFDNNGCEYQIIVEIEFYELGMCFTNGYEHFFSAMLTSPVDTEKYVEIIGNSFDNPELLESGDFDE